MFKVVVVLQLALIFKGKIAISADPSSVMSSITTMVVDSFAGFKLLLAGIAPVKHGVIHFASLDGICRPTQRCAEVVEIRKSPKCLKMSYGGWSDPALPRYFAASVWKLAGTNRFWCSRSFEREAVESASIRLKTKRQY